MVTAELATALPVLVLVLLVSVAAISVEQQRIRCVDGAREAAVALARGDIAAAPGLAEAGAGHPVAVSVSQSSTQTTVTVRLDFHPLSWLPNLVIAEAATVATEPTGLNE